MKLYVNLSRQGECLECSRIGLILCNFSVEKTFQGIDRNPKESIRLLTMDNAKTILEAMRDGFLTTDVFGRILLINRVAERLLGLEQGASVGQPVEEVLPTIGTLVEKAEKTNDCQSAWETCSRGKRLSVELTPLHCGPATSGYLCRIHSPELMDASVQHLNEQLDAIIEFSSDGIWVSDHEGVVLRINKASERLCGITAGDVVGKSIREAVDRGIIDTSATLRVLKEKRPVNLIQYVKRTGKHLLVTGTPLYGEDGRMSLVVVNERDITLLYAMKEQIEGGHISFQDEASSEPEYNPGDPACYGIVASNRAMKQVMRVAEKLASMDASNILILGESGTGKGMLAQYIHNRSPGKDRPFVQINCAALPESLFEAEVFGYEKGAFTGAREQGKAGLIESAKGGTLFLDEIGEASPSAQAKLLKYLDDHHVLRLGGTKAVQIDCKIIAATNRDLAVRVRQEAFRKDLYYRLNTFTLNLPPLRERPEDIFDLFNHYLHQFNKQYGLKRRVTPEMMLMLQDYPFPGNVRELRSLIKKAVVMSDEDLLDEILIDELAGYKDPSTKASTKIAPTASLNFKNELAKKEMEILEQAVKKCRTTREIARYLGLSQPTVVRKLKRYGFSPHLIHN
jgi:PAS domain S-box-containing protein